MPCPYEHLEDMPGSCSKVLFHIARKGPKTKYQIEKEIRINHATIHESIKILLACRLVTGEKIGTTRVGLAKIEYKLTAKGLVEAIRTFKREYVEEIVHKWMYVEPLLVAKWDYFVAKLGKRKVENLIHGAAKYFEWSDNDVSYDVQFFVSWVVEYLFSDSDIMDEEVLEKWIRAFKGDKQLKQVVLDYIDGEIKLSRSILKRASFLKKRFSIRS